MSQTETSGPAYTPRRRRGLRIILLLIVPLLAIITGGLLYFDGGRYVSTENAYVKAHKVAISSDLDGRVVAVEIRDNEFVQKGQVLFRLDDQPLQIQLAGRQAELAVVQADIEALRATYRQERAELKLAEERLAYTEREHKRQQKLSRTGVVSASTFDETEQEMREARRRVAVLRESMNQTLVRLGGDSAIAVENHPRYRQAQTALKQVELDIERTVIRAPSSGQLSRVSLEAGEYVEAGQAVFSLVGTGALWIDANFKETQLTHIQTGQTASIEADTFPGLTWQAEVSSISAATGAEFSLLPPQNASGNWVKVVQRIPVSLKLLESHPQAELRAGMSVQVTIDTGARNTLPAPLAEWRRNLLTWLHLKSDANAPAEEVEVQQATSG